MSRHTVASAYMQGWNFASRLVEEIDKMVSSGCFNQSEGLRLWLNVLEETRGAFNSDDEYGNGMLAALWAVSEDNPDDVLLPSYEEKVRTDGEPFVFTYRMTKVAGVVEVMSVRSMSGQEV